MVWPNERCFKDAFAESIAVAPAAGVEVFIATDYRHFK